MRVSGAEVPRGWTSTYFVLVMFASATGLVVLLHLWARAGPEIVEFMFTVAFALALVFGWRSGNGTYVGVPGGVSKQEIVTRVEALGYRPVRSTREYLLFRSVRGLRLGRAYLAFTPQGYVLRAPRGRLKTFKTALGNRNALARGKDTVAPTPPPDRVWPGGLMFLLAFAVGWIILALVPFFLVPWNTVQTLLFDTAIAAVIAWLWVRTRIGLVRLPRETMPWGRLQTLLAGGGLVEVGTSPNWRLYRGVGAIRGVKRLHVVLDGDHFHVYGPRWFVARIRAVASRPPGNEHDGRRRSVARTSGPARSTP